MTNVSNVYFGLSGDETAARFGGSWTGAAGAGSIRATVGGSVR
jgi:hypothetical protein